MSILNFLKAIFTFDICDLANLDWKLSDKDVEEINKQLFK